MRLTLDAAVRMALERNPGLIGLRQNEPVSLATLQTSRTYIFNPQYQTQVLPYNRDRNGDLGAVNQQHVIVQTFELAGQQRFREGSARSALNQVRWNVLQAELLNTALTEQLFFTALYQRALRDQAKSIADINLKLLGVVQRRFKAGLAKTADVVLARQVRRTTRRQADLAEATYQTGLLALRRQINIAKGTSFDVEGDLSAWKWRSVAQAVKDWSASTSDGVTMPSDSRRLPKAPGLGNSALPRDSKSRTLDETILAELISRRPDVLSARAAADVARSTYQLARAARTPNLQIGPMYQRDEVATEFWGIQAQITLPVVNTGRPLMRQRRTELRRAQVVRNQLEVQARLDARAAIERYERARRLVEQARGDFTTSLSKALAPIESEFKAGQIDLLRVIAVRASLVQARQTYFGLLNELAQSAAAVTAATGLPARRLILVPTPSSNEPKALPTP
ncbi:MAG: TolC family protein [Planctomycetaceae bacterium]